MVRYKFGGDRSQSMTLSDFYREWVRITMWFGIHTILETKFYSERWIIMEMGLITKEVIPIRMACSMWLIFSPFLTVKFSILFRKDNMSSESSESRLKSEFNGMLDDEMETYRGPSGGDPRMSSSNAQAGSSRLWRGGFVEQSLTPVTGRKIEPKMGSVFHRGVSPVQNFRSRMSTVNGSVFPSSEPADGYEEAELREAMEEEGGLSAELMTRLRAAEDNITHEFATEDNREERGVRQNTFPSGDFRYFLST